MNTATLARAIEIRRSIDQLLYKIESLDELKDNIAMDGFFIIQSIHKNLSSFEAPSDLIKGWFDDEIFEAKAEIKLLENEFDSL